MTNPTPFQGTKTGRLARGGGGVTHATFSAIDPTKRIGLAGDRMRVKTLCSRYLAPTSIYEPDQWPDLADRSLRSAGYQTGVCRACAERTPGAFEDGSITWPDGSITARARRTARSGALLVWSDYRRVYVAPSDPARSLVFTPASAPESVAVGA